MIPIYLHLPSSRAAPVSLSRDASSPQPPLPQQNHGMETIQLLLSVPAGSPKNLLQPSQLQVSQGGQEEGSNKNPSRQLQQAEQEPQSVEMPWLEQKEGFRA